MTCPPTPGACTAWLQLQKPAPQHLRAGTMAQSRVDHPDDNVSCGTCNPRSSGHQADTLPSTLRSNAQSTCSNVNACPETGAVHPPVHATPPKVNIHGIPEQESLHQTLFATAPGEQQSSAHGGLDRKRPTQPSTRDNMVMAPAILGQECMRHSAAAFTPKGAAARPDDLDAAAQRSLPSDANGPMSEGTGHVWAARFIFALSDLVVQTRGSGLHTRCLIRWTLD